LGYLFLENLQFFVQDATKHDIPALHGFMERAKSMYDENMTAYIRAVLRRSFGRPWVGALLEITGPSTSLTDYLAPDRTSSKPFKSNFELLRLKRSLPAHHTIRPP
jgi:hypothetical protein